MRIQFLVRARAFEGFKQVSDNDPECTMAYWGAAMTTASASNPHLEIEQFATQGRIADDSPRWQRTIVSDWPTIR
jgi:hypothetical protein